MTQTRQPLREDDSPGFIWPAAAVLWSIVIGLSVAFAVRHWLAAMLRLRPGPVGRQVIEATINRAAIGLGLGAGLVVLAVLVALFVVRSSETRAFQWVWHIAAVLASVVIGAALAYGSRHWLAATLRLPAGPVPGSPLDGTMNRASLGMGAAGGLGLLAVLTGLGAVRGWLAGRVRLREDLALRERAQSTWQQEIERLAAQAQLAAAAPVAQEVVPPAAPQTLEPAREGGEEEAAARAPARGRRTAKKTAQRTRRRRAAAEASSEARTDAAETTSKAEPGPAEATAATEAQAEGAKAAPRSGQTAAVPTVEPATERGDGEVNQRKTTTRRPKSTKKTTKKTTRRRVRAEARSGQAAEAPERAE
ncbi:MAG: hypothetical protein M3198_10250, partial [Actinomycetota bacterium]|nr:hypothetical protein [Actinomycetota bacterium]